MATPKSNSFAFTDTKISRLKAGDRRLEFGDTGAPGLRLRIETTGRKSFVFYYHKPGGKRGVVTIGQFPVMSLDKARGELTTLKARLEDGEEARESETPVTVKQLADQWHKTLLTRRKRPEDARRTLDHDVLPVIGSKRLRSLTTASCRRVVQTVIDRGSDGYAVKVLAILKQMLSFGESIGAVDHSPAASLKADTFGLIANERDRTLDHDDIQALLAALERAPRMSELTKAALQLLLFTGVRTGELLQARWRDVDFDAAAWTIPVEHQKVSPARAKNAKPFVVPLSTQALEQFTRLHKLTGRKPHVFASDAKEGHLSDKVLGRSVRRMFDSEMLTVERFTPHDLRRTLRSGLSALGVDTLVAERCLNHSVGRIERTYDRFDYLDVRRDALQKWGDHVTGDKPAGEVVAFRVSA